MSYAPAQSQTQAPAALAMNDPTAALDCVPESGSGTTQHDAWLVSFIDILILLLVLFVLLLTHQQDGTGPMDKAGQGKADPVIETVAANAPFRQALELPVLLSVPDTVAEIFTIGAELTLPSLAAVNMTEAPDTNLPTEEPESIAESPAATATDGTVQTVEPLTVSNAVSDDEAATEEQDIHLQAAAETHDAALTNPDPMKAFLDSFENSELRDRVELSIHGAGVNLAISDNILFSPANAALTPSGIAVLDRLAGALKEQAYHLSIEGHTDNIPIETARFPSNWELSTARAAIVARHLVNQGISAGRIRAIGYADTRPRADNLTPQGRSRNRRVSLVLQVPSGYN